VRKACRSNVQAVSLQLGRRVSSFVTQICGIYAPVALAEEAEWEEAGDRMADRGKSERKERQKKRR
jgi:hypothetical protein